MAVILVNYGLCPRYDELSEMRDVYISVDIETDGPVPGPFSMLSIGLCVAGEFDGSTYSRADGFDRSLYLELQPVGTEIDPEALEINGLDREKLKTEGTSPGEAIAAISRWVALESTGRNAVLVAYPLAFDWPFVSWYFNRFGQSGSPFGHASCLDIRTLYLAKAHTLFSESGKSSIPGFLMPSQAHTHNALDDAKEQAELFSNIFEWEPQATPLSA